MESSDVVCLRDFGIEFVGAVPWGTHLCQFYKSKQDLIDVLVPFFAAGLRDNEFCMWVTSPPLEVSEAKEALKKAVPDLENYLQKGQMEIVSYDDWYLLGGKFDSNRVLEGWVKKEKAAFKNGFEGLRLNGNTFWVERGLWRSFVDYEEAANRVIEQHKMVALCTYCTAKISGADVLDIIRNHKGTLLKQGENWVLVENAIERKRDEDALVEREQSWQTTLGSIGDAVIATDISGKITFMNKVAEKLTGWTLSNASEEPLDRAFCIVNEKTRREVENPVARVLKEGVVVGLANHTVLIRKDGTEIPIDDSGAPIKSKDGKVAGVVLVFRDISERKKAEEEFRELQERLLLQVNRMPIGLIVWDSEFRAITWNPAAARIFGFTEQEALGKHPYGLIVPKEAQPIVDEIWSRLLKGDESANSVNENMTKSGRTIVCDWSNTPLKKDDGTVIGVLSMVQDITERKNAEEALHQSEERLRLRLDNLLSPDAELDEQDLQNILDVPSLQAMMDNLYEVTKMGIAIIDLKGNVLVATGWQDICTKFHRLNPETCHNCIESDLYLTEEVTPGEIRLYKCKNNMWDAVTPLVIGKKHVGNVFFGQFFFEGEVVDRSVFAKQAETYGFDKERYMAAFDKIPRFSRERVENLLKFYAKMAGLTSKLSFSNLQLAKSLSIQKDMRLKLEDYAKNLENLVKERTDRLESTLLYSRTLIEASLDPLVTISAEGKITDVNKATEETTGFSREQLIGSDFSDYFTEPEKAREGYKQAFTKGYVKDYSLAIKSKAGKITEVVYNATVYRNESGVIQGVLAAARDVTERRKAEAAVQAERKRFYDVLETLPTMVCLLTPDYHVIFANKSFREKFGESHGRHCYDYCFGRKEPCSFCESYKVLETKKPHQWEVRGPDGSIIEAYDFPFNDIDGSPLILEMDIDVTQRKKAEEAVQNERKRLFDVLETIPAMVCLITPDYHIAFANRSFKEQFGESRGRHCYDYCFGQTEPCKFCESLIPLKTGKPHHWEVKGPDGSVIEAHDYPFSDIDGSPLILEMDIDVTRQRKTEEQLRTASQYARSLLEASLDPLVTISADGKITDVNQATEEATGRSRQELIGCDFSDFFTEPEEARKGYQKVFIDGVVRDYPLAIRHASGKVMDVLYNATLYANEAGKVQGVFAAARDVTERNKAEAALARQAELIELTPDAFIVMSPHGDARFWSRGAERLYGWQSSEVIGKQIHELLKTTFPEPLENIMRSLTERGGWSGELLQRNKDGRALVVQSRWIPKINESGRITEVLKSNVDITQRKAMENEITQTSERLRQSNAELEQFAYVASHDLQEPLRMVASYVQLLQKRYQGKLDAEADEFIDYAVDGANRMRGLIDDLLIYSRVGRLGKPFERTSVESTLNIALKNLETSITENNATITHDKLPVINADAGQLVQLFQNLVGNAIKFHGNEPPKVHVSARDKGSEFEFEVADNGIGIDPQYFDRLFKIFQRLHTRDEYPGSGIGLAVCKKIVERHGGRIWIESESGKGSTIYFTLSKRKEQMQI